MKIFDLKNLIVRSLDDEPRMDDLSKRLEEAGVSYDFQPGFTRRVLDRIFSAEVIISRQMEFSRYLNLAFSRIALTGVAAIMLLLLSIYFMEGSFSLNSLLGLSNNYDESIVCLLTGN